MVLGYPISGAGNLQPCPGPIKHSNRPGLFHAPESSGFCGRGDFRRAESLQDRQKNFFSAEIRQEGGLRRPAGLRGASKSEIRLTRTARRCIFFPWINLPAPAEPDPSGQTCTAQPLRRYGPPGRRPPVIFPPAPVFLTPLRFSRLQAPSLTGRAHGALQNETAPAVSRGLVPARRDRERDKRVLNRSLRRRAQTAPVSSFPRSGVFPCPRRPLAFPSGTCRSEPVFPGPPLSEALPFLFSLA